LVSLKEGQEVEDDARLKECRRKGQSKEKTKEKKKEK